VGTDGIYVLFLGDAFGCNDPFPGGDKDRIEKDLFQGKGIVAGQDAMGVIDVGGVNGIPFLNNPVKLKKEVFDQFDGDRVSGKGNVVAPGGHFDRFQFFDEMNVFILFTQKMFQCFIMRKSQYFNDF